MVGGLKKQIEKPDSEAEFLVKIAASIIQIFIVICILYWAKNRKMVADLVERYKLV